VKQFLRLVACISLPLMASEVAAFVFSDAAGFAVESKLAAFYGPGSPYWAGTLKCADAASESTPKASR
jgi:hypothetical protein